MAYFIKEIFYSLQGEGAHAGRPAVFCRFSGCNLWSGREADRSTAICKFCDTDFVGTNGTFGGRYTNAESLAARISALWPETTHESKFVIFTGGEPLLQLDSNLVTCMKQKGFFIAIETNGTQPVCPGIDWVCVSPKAGSDLRVTEGDELKVVFPQTELSLVALRQLSFKHFFVQPMDGPEFDRNLSNTINFCLENPSWRLSMQTHKLIGVR